jgi:hypothetical protein
MICTRHLYGNKMTRDLGSSTTEDNDNSNNIRPTRQSSGRLTAADDFYIRRPNLNEFNEQ